MVLMIDLLIAALFAASLHFIMGPAGMHSFGHAAYFGLGAYGAALLRQALGLPMELSLLARAAGRRARRLRLRLVLRAALGRLPGDADARLRADRLVGHVPVGRVHRRQQRPDRHLAGGVAGAPSRPTTCWCSPAPVGRRAACCGAMLLLAVRPSAARQPRFAAARRRRSASTCQRLQWAAFVVAGTVAGLAGALFAFAKGSISPETLGVAKSVDGLVMVLLGGVQTLAGPVGRRGRSSPGCRTRWRARPTTGARCSASSCWCWCWCSRTASPAC